MSRLIQRGINTVPNNYANAKGTFLQPLTMQFRKSFRYAKHRFIIVRITVKDDGVSKYSSWILQPFGEDALC